MDSVLDMSFAPAIAFQSVNSVDFPITAAVSSHYSLVIQKWAVDGEISTFDYERAFPDLTWTHKTKRMWLDCDKGYQAASDRSIKNLFWYNIDCNIHNITGQSQLYYDVCEAMPSEEQHPARGRIVPVKVPCDLVAADQGGVYLVVDIELPHCAVEQQLLQLSQCEWDVNSARTQDGDAGVAQGLCAVSKLVGNMRDGRCKYGILTTYNYTWLVHEFEPCKVRVTRAFHIAETRPSVLAVVLYALGAAKVDASPPYDLTPEAELRRVETSAGVTANTVSGPTVQERSSNASEAQLQHPSNAGDAGATVNSSAPSPARAVTVRSVPTPGGLVHMFTTILAAGTDAGTSFTGGKRVRADESDSANPTKLPRHLRRAGNITWAMMTSGRVLGRGASGSVHLCTAVGRNARSVAVKLFTATSEQSQRDYGQECLMYDLMKPYQGIYVPKLYTTGIESPSGQIRGIAMEVCQRLPKEFEDWSPEECQQAVAVLKKLSKRLHIVHGDVRTYNFMKNAAGRVVAIDFAYAAVEPDEMKRRRALGRAIQAIEGWPRNSARVTRASTSAQEASGLVGTVAVEEHQ